jgi:uncharacterized protein (DUF2141 family)
MRIASLLSLTLLAPFALGAAGGGASIDVAVTNVTVAKGRIHVDICPEKQFMTSDCPYIGEAPAVIGTTIVVVRDVPPGRYAAQGFHDRNSDGHLNRGLFGIPKEPIGVSNDAPIRMAPPKFADAAFEHGATPQHISFRLRSFF